MGVDPLVPRGTVETILLVAGLFFVLQGIDFIANVSLFLYDQAVRSGVFPTDTMSFANDSVGYAIGFLSLFVGIILVIWSRQIHRELPTPVVPPPPP